MTKSAHAKPQVFIISGKSPIADSGGYPAYAQNLARMLTANGHIVNLFAIGDTSGSKKTPFGTVHFSGTRLVRMFPILRHLALAGLPYYTIILYQTMKRVLISANNKRCIVWGMGPWGFPGVFLKLFPPPHTTVSLFTSYFTSTRHEMGGAYRAIRIRDYGIIPKIKYFFVYHVVARIFHVFEQITLWWCDRIIVHYQSSEKIVKKYFILPSRQSIIRFPWYVDIFPREGEQTKSPASYPHPLIVSVCRQDPRKGLNFLIRAMKIVVKVNPRAHCLIVGTGELLEPHKNLVRKLHLEHHVSVIGFVPDIRPVLKEADIAVIVPLAQGSSALTVLEAMSSRKAIIGSDCDGIPEDITHQKSGLIVPPGDEIALAQAIIKLIQSPTLRKRLGSGAFAAYQKHFGLQKMQQSLRRLTTS